MQGGGGYPVQGGGFQVGVGGSTGVSVSTGGGGVATTRYSRRDADDEIVDKLAPSKKEQSTLVARKEEKLANRGLLTWAAVSILRFRFRRDLANSFNSYLTGVNGSSVSLLARLPPLHHAKVPRERKVEQADGQGARQGGAQTAKVDRR